MPSAIFICFLHYKDMINLKKGENKLTRRRNNKDTLIAQIVATMLLVAMVVAGVTVYARASALREGIDDADNINYSSKKGISFAETYMKINKNEETGVCNIGVYCKNCDTRLVIGEYDPESKEITVRFLNSKEECCKDLDQEFGGDLFDRLIKEFPDNMSYIVSK